MTTKETNPKDSCGIMKVPASTVPRPVIHEVGLAMLEGARKYARHNYRVTGVRASVYYDAAHRHLDDWWEGVDIDPDSGLSHVTKAIASLVVLRDAMMNDKFIDDRPPPCKPGWLARLNALAAEIIKRHPDPKEACVAVRPRIECRTCKHDVVLYAAHCHESGCAGNPDYPGWEMKYAR
jgi:hypothetical protein